MDGQLSSIKSCVRFSIEFFLFHHYHHHHHQSPPLSSSVIDSLHLVDPGVAVFGGVG